MKIASVGLTSFEALVSFLLRALSRVPVIDIKVAASDQANGPFTVLHDLSTAPAFIMALPWGQASVWATEDDRRLWTDKKATLHCDTASTKLTLLFLAL